MSPIIFAVEPFGGSVRDHNPNLPLVFWDDAAVTRGDGVFETLLLRDGRICNLDRHVSRFLASAKLLDLPEPNIDGWLKATIMAAEKWRSHTTDDASCVWMYTRGRETTGIPSAWLTIRPLSPTALHQPPRRSHRPPGNHRSRPLACCWRENPQLCRQHGGAPLGPRPRLR